MVFVFLAEGFEEVEALTPVDYLRRCGLTVKTIGLPGKTVRGARGITVVADGTMDDVTGERIELLVLPGGMPGAKNLEQSAPLQALLADSFQRDVPIGAICAAPSILGRMGLLAGRRVTCFPGFEEACRGAECTGAAVEIDGRLVTGRGPGAANEFAFALAEMLCGRERADELRASVQFRN